jgi:hypothetical protein
MNKKLIEPGVLDEARELWRCQLEAIPSLFARLAYMSSLRRPDERYHDLEIASLVGKARCHQIIHSSYTATLRTWFALRLREKATDLRPYLATLPEGRTAVRWRHSWMEFARDIVPADINPTERELFVRMLDSVLELLSSM